MTVTEPTPLHPRSLNFRQTVLSILGPEADQSAVERISAAHTDALRETETRMDSLRRSEGDAHAQHYVSWRMMEFMQATMSAQLRRAAALHARCQQSGAILGNIRHLIGDAENAGRGVSLVDLKACLTAVDPRPVLPQTVLGMVPDNAYRSGVFEGASDGPPVEYRFPYYGVALVTTNTEPERIQEPCFMVGDRVLTASAIGQQMGVTLKTYE